MELNLLKEVMLLNLLESIELLLNSIIEAIVWYFEIIIYNIRSTNGINATFQLN